MSAYSPAPHFINNISPKNPHIGTIASLLRFNDGPGSTAFTDAASITWTASGPVTESATHILSYTSAGDYSGAGAFNIATLTTPNTGNLLGFEVNPWCIECFAYVVTGTNQTLCAKWPAAGTQGQFQIIFNYAAGVPISLISFTQWVNGNSTGQVSFTSLNPSLFPNSWAHYAITYDGTGYRIFVN